MLPNLTSLQKKGIPYRTCIDREFSKLTTPNLSDPDVFPLLRISDDTVFAATAAPCATLRSALEAEMPRSEAFAKIIGNWEEAVDARFRRIVGRDRAGLASRARAIRTPGPRVAVPLVEFVSDADFQLVNGKHEQGRTTATYTVGTDGRVSNCKAVGGADTLNFGACAVIVRRWRYAPALDAAGRPIAEVRNKAIDLRGN